MYLGRRCSAAARDRGPGGHHECLAGRIDDAVSSLAHFLASPVPLDAFLSLFCFCPSHLQVDALLRRLQEVESQAAARDASQAEQVAVLQQLREEEIEALKAQHASEIEELRGRYAGQIEGLQGQLRGEVEGSRGRYQGEIEALKEQHVKAEDALRAERDKATKDLARLKQHLLHIVSTALLYASGGYGLKRFSSHRSKELETPFK